jgi:RNA polymerase-binding transcription factor DksA
VRLTHYSGPAIRGRAVRRRGSLAVVADVDNDSVAAIESQLNAVDHALERLRQGTYRSCQVCGAPIDDTDLVGRPTLANCPVHPELG